MLQFLYESAFSLFIAIALLLVFIYTLSKFISTSKPGRNPFTFDSTKPAKPLVVDQKERDKVIKQGFQAKLVPDNLDAVVIGSGIGGLAAAAILAKTGKKVLVLEQHDQAGGCCHTFVDKGFEFDVGIHYIGEMRSKTVLKLLVDQLSNGQLQWCDLIDEFDVVAIGEAGKQQFYPFNAGGYEAFKKSLLNKFPKQEKSIDKYISLLKEVRRSMMGMMIVKVIPKWIVRLLIATRLIHLITSYFKLSSRTLKEVLDEVTDDATLKAVLSYSWGDYGVPPSQSSFAFHATLINHYIYGASYPRGGASEIAFTIIPVIENAGGRVLVRAPVTAINTDSTGKVTGVTVGRSSGSVHINAPLVISDAGVVNTFTKLLPQEVAKQSSMYQLLARRTVDSGIACMSLFVGLNGTAEELGVKPQNIWMFARNDLDSVANEFVSKTAEEAGNGEVPFLFVSFPSAKDPTFAERFPGKTVCTAITIARWEWFEQWQDERVSKRGADYNSIKTAICRRMWEQVLSVYPHLDNKVEYMDVGSPLSNNYYLGSPRGEIYGLDHNVKRFGNPEVLMHLRPDTEIPGLLLTGQDVLSCGFAGALFGGLLCASSVLNRNLYSDLVNLRKRLRKGE